MQEAYRMAETAIQEMSRETRHGRALIASFFPNAVAQLRLGGSEGRKVAPLVHARSVLVWEAPHDSPS